MTPTPGANPRMQWPPHGGQQAGSGPYHHGVGDTASPGWVFPGCLGDAGLAALA